MEWATLQHLDLRHVGRSSKSLQPHAAAFHPTQALLAVAVGSYIIEFDAYTGSKIASIDLGSPVVRMAYSPTSGHCVIAILEIGAAIIPNTQLVIAALADLPLAILFAHSSSCCQSSTFLFIPSHCSILLDSCSVAMQSKSKCSNVSSGVCHLESDRTHPAWAPVFQIFGVYLQLLASFKQPAKE